MTTNVGYASLQIIPTTKDFGANLAQQVTPQMTAAGETGGRSFGSAFATTMKAGAAVAATGLLAVAGVALTKGFTRLTDIENATASLEGLGHSSKAVSGIMDNALGSVRGTFFGMGEAATVAATAVAAGVKPGKDLEGTLKLVADAATIGGTSMTEMGAIFNKVATSNKVQGDTIAQLNDRGIPIIQLLGKEMGKTSAEITELASQGKIDFNTFRDAMERGMGGAALNAGNTTEGAFKNMISALSRVGANFLTGVFPLFRKGFLLIIDLLEPIEAQATKVGKVLGDFLKPLFGDLKRLLTGGGITEVSASIKEFFAGLSSGDGDGGAFRETMAGIWDSLKRLGPVFQQFAAAVPQLTNVLTLGAVVLEFFARHADTLARMMPLLVAAFVAYKVAAAAASAAVVLRLPIMTGQLILTRQLAASNVQLTAAVNAATGATAGQNTVEKVGLLTRAKATAATVAHRVATVAVAAATKVWTGIQLAFNLVMAANPIALVVLAIVALVAAIVIAYKNSETFRNIVQAAWEGIKQAFAAALAFIVPLLQQAWAKILEAFNWLKTTIWPLVQQYLSLISTVFTTYVKAWGSVIQAAWALIAKAFDVIRTYIWPLVQRYVGIITAFWMGAWKVLSVAVKLVFAVIQVAIQIFFRWVVPTIRKYLSIVKAVWSGVWKVLGPIVRAAWAVIKGVVQAGVAVVKGLIAGIRAIIGVVSSIFNAVVNAIRGPVDRAVAVVKGLKDRVVGFFSGAWNWLYDAGKDMIQGLIDGAGSLLSKIGEFFLDKLPGWMVTPFKKALGIDSPSKVFIDLGKNVVEGLAKGLADGEGKKAVEQAMGEVLDSVESAAQRIVDKIREAGKEALSFSRSIAQSVQSFGALEANSDGVLTGKSVVSDLASKVAAAKQFGTYLVRLKRLGLNNASLQQIIAAGPIDGSQIAKALLTSGEKAIRQVNTLETQLGRAARTVGDVGVRSEFGMTTAQARAQAGAKLEVQKDAVKITFNGDPGRTVRKDVADAVDEAFDKVMDKWERKVAREARSRQRN